MPASFLMEKTITIRSVEAVHTALTQALAENMSLEIDCSAVEEADITLPQLILAAYRSAKTQGKTVVLSSPPAGVLRDVLIRGGFLGSSEAPTEFSAFWASSAHASSSRTGGTVSP